MAEELTLRQAMEQLYEDERLRAELTDEQATVLLRWGETELRAAMQRDQSLADTLGRVRATARRINEIVAGWADGDEADLEGRLRALAEQPAPALPRLVRRWLRRGDAIDALLDRRAGLVGPALVQALLDLGTAPGRPRPVTPSRTGLWLLLVLLVGGLLLALVVIGGQSGRRPAPLPVPPAGNDRPAPGEPVVRAPVEVFFTAPHYPDRPADRRGGLDERLDAWLGTAQRSIDLAIYDLDLPNVTRTLIAAQQRGVRVRLVTDTDNLDTEAVQQLRRAGVPVVDDKRRAIMHHKFAVVDGASVWMGSWNFTTNDTYRYNNNAALWRDQRLAENFSVEFEKLFRGQFGPTKPVAIPYPVVVINNVRIETHFAPETDPSTAIIRRLQGAQRSITFLAYSFTHDGIGAAMIERGRRGVQVRGIFETTGSETQFSEFGPLRAANLQVMADGNPYLMHHKVIVIDEQTVIFGSFNFSSNAASDNDENCLIVDDAGLARLFLAEYERVQAVARNPPARR